MSTSIGKIIDAMFNAREEYRKALDYAKTCEKVVKDLEIRLIQTMRAADVEYSRTSLATATIKTREPGTIRDWSSFTPWVEEDVPNRIHLLEKRIAQLAFKEYMETANKLPPGVDVYSVESIGLTKLS